MRFAHVSDKALGEEAEVQKCWARPGRHKWTAFYVLENYQVPPARTGGQFDADPLSTKCSGLFGLRPEGEARLGHEDIIVDLWVAEQQAGPRGALHTILLAYK